MKNKILRKKEKLFKSQLKPLKLKNRKLLIQLGVNEIIEIIRSY